MAKGNARRIIPPLEDVQPPTRSSKESVGIPFRLLSFTIKDSNYPDPNTGAKRKFVLMQCIDLRYEGEESESITAGGEVVVKQMASVHLEDLPIEFVFRKSGQQIYMEQTD